MAIKLTLICPVYKVAEFIPELMDSLVAGVNTENVEVIFVDDCCPENSINLCEDFLAKNKSTIKFSTTIIKQPTNKGQAAARNAALLVAKGEYIGFIDSDDAIAPNYWQVLSPYIEQANKDIIEFTFEEFTTRIPRQNSNEVKELESSVLNPFFSGFFVWTRLYKKNVLAEVSFPEGMIYEDVFFNVHAFSHSTFTVKLSTSLVYYRKRAGSTTSIRTSTYSQLLVNLVNAVISTISAFSDKDVVVRQVAQFSFLTVLKGIKIKDKSDRRLFFKKCQQILITFNPLFIQYNSSFTASIKFKIAKSLCVLGKYA
ncbi:hypothetical protein F0Z19_1174 [Vibrio cyclitrophicus]|nr:hypothetical protein F0Z19_1174 [Vibrio cyclitrophicus]